jgi:hypothetical protein
MQQYPQVHALWLLIGNSEPLLLSPSKHNLTTTNAANFFRSSVVGADHGIAHQENNATPTAIDSENLKNKLALVEQENAYLKAQPAT